MADAPESFRHYLRDGFNQISKLPRDKLPDLLTLMAEHRRPNNSVLRSATKRIGLSEGSAGPQLIAAVTFALGFMIENRDLTPPQFLAALSKAGLLDESALSSAEGLFKAIDDRRVELAKITERANHGSALLPSLVTFSSLVDARPKFIANEISFAVSVALVRLSTDADEEISFQMTKAELALFIADLQEAQRRIDLVDQWIAKKGMVG